MAEINLPPFYVGQRVVHIREFTKKYTEHIIYPTKDKVYTIRTIHYSKRHKGWFLRFEELVNKIVQSKYELSEPSFSVNNFSPIIENFQSITLEKVLEEETKLISVN